MEEESKKQYGFDANQGHGNHIDCLSDTENTAAHSKEIAFPESPQGTRSGQGHSLASRLLPGSGSCRGRQQ